MGDPREPPEGTPDGGSGNEDEYRSVVFDESFVRAARIQELSARERLGGHYPRAVRPRVFLGPFGSLPRQAVALLLLVAMAFAAAVYFGVSSPHRLTAAPTGNQLTVSLVALSPVSPVAAVADTKNPFAALPSGYADGSAGFGVPAPSATEHFTKAEVTRALDVAQSYLTAADLSPAVLVQGETGEVRSLITPGEQAQYDQSINNARDDQHHAATGWLVRFDPGQVALASDVVKVTGTMQVTEVDTGTLEVTTDHTFVYALRPAGTESPVLVSLFSVRRELRLEFDRADIGAGHLRVVDAVEQAGPTTCGTPLADHFQPVLATRGPVPAAPPASPAPVNPGDHAHPAWQLCGVLG
ncbi:SCO2583 family membrane protein [Kitasatospora sp. McL0602]|uniref:SCO2583 family membrane protein n=1 Tax=Kitasatospora sp. McL0602 TaxID=3439530 RepID=UPI003F8A83CD